MSIFRKAYTQPAKSQLSNIYRVCIVSLVLRGDNTIPLVLPLYDADLVLFANIFEMSTLHQLSACKFPSISAVLHAGSLSVVFCSVASMLSVPLPPPWLFLIRVGG